MSKKKENKLRSSEVELLRIFIYGDDEALMYLENNLEISFINNKSVKKLAKYFRSEYINQGEIKLKKALEDIKGLEQKILITSYINERGKVSDINAAKKVIKLLTIDKLEDERDKLKKDPNLVNEVFEITKQINNLREESK